MHIYNKIDASFTNFEVDYFESKTVREFVNVESNQIIEGELI